MIWFLIAILAVGLLIMAVISSAPAGKTKKRSSRRPGYTRVGSVDREFVARKWAEISAMSQGNGGSLRSAVGEADKLLDYALKGLGVHGDTMGERLKHSRGRFSNLNDIWTAHKLRNALAHEADFDLVPSQAKEALRFFEQGLKDLGVL
jgi:hypothetical protein